MLVDANLLLYARDTRSRFHAAAREWLEDALNGPVRVGIPWHSAVGFMRIATNPRSSERPLSPDEAAGQVRRWLSAPAAWIPLPTHRHEDVFLGLVEQYELRGNLVSHAHLATLAIEHGVEVCSADTDFARFTEIRWTNPVAR